jgi:hypothetical protein
MSTHWRLGYALALLCSERRDPPLVVPCKLPTGPPLRNAARPLPAPGTLPRLAAALLPCELETATCFLRPLR